MLPVERLHRRGVRTRPASARQRMEGRLLAGLSNTMGGGGADLGATSVRQETDARLAPYWIPGVRAAEGHLLAGDCRRAGWRRPSLSSQPRRALQWVFGWNRVGSVNKIFSCETTLFPVWAAGNQSSGVFSSTPAGRRLQALPAPCPGVQQAKKQLRGLAATRSSSPESPQLPASFFPPSGASRSLGCVISMYFQL